jgi:hypothetical protein
MNEMKNAIQRKIGRQLVMFVMLLSICIMVPRPVVAGETGFFEYSGLRFYSAVSVDLDGDGAVEIIAVGQKDGPKDFGHHGYVAIFKVKGKTLELAAEDTFTVNHEEKELQGRCRAVEVVPAPGKGTWYIYSSGRGGSDDTGVGFLKFWRYDARKAGILESAQTEVFHVAAGKYTHGYPLKVADVTGDDGLEVIYGGFSGENDLDYADVHVFQTGKDGKLVPTDLKPFETLSVPLRVNALETVDIDGDKKAEIIIAGRTKGTGKKSEKAVFAWWKAGKVFHRVVKTPTAARLRTMLTVDLDNDGTTEIIVGGRMKLGKNTAGFMSSWNIKDDKAVLLGTYSWAHNGSVKLRAFAPCPANGRFMAAGRSEIWNGIDNNWEGFIGQFIYENGKLMPVRKMDLFKKGHETRIRSLFHMGNGKYVGSGFILDAKKGSSGFLVFYEL